MAKFKEVLVTVLVSVLFLGRNVRDYATAKIDQLATDLAHNGQDKRIETYIDAEGREQVIEGHRRGKAMLLLQSYPDDHPDKIAAFETFGPDPAKWELESRRLEGLTESEAQLRKLDHGNEVGLVTQLELAWSIFLAMDNGCTGRAKLVSQLAGLMDRVQPLKGKAKTEIDALIKAGDGTGAAKRLAEARAGLCQKFQNLYNAPPVVVAAWSEQQGHTVPGFEGANLPKISTSDINAVIKAVNEDKEIMGDDNVPKYGKLNPGPNFNTKWAALINRQTDRNVKAAKGDTRKHSLSHTDLKAMTTDYNSRVVRLALTLASGVKIDVPVLKELDRQAYLSERLREYDNEVMVEYDAQAEIADAELKAQAAAAAEADEAKSEETAPEAEEVDSE